MERWTTMKKASDYVEPLRAGARRFQLAIGVGFVSLVLGAYISSAVLSVLAPRLSHSTFFVDLLLALVAKLWVVGVLPVLMFLLARIVAFEPWAAAVVSAFTGQAFVLGLDMVAGFPPEEQSDRFRLLGSVFFIVGVVLTQ